MMYEEFVEKHGTQRIFLWERNTEAGITVLQIVLPLFHSDKIRYTSPGSYTEYDIDDSVLVPFAKDFELKRGDMVAVNDRILTNKNIFEIDDIYDGKVDLKKGTSIISVNLSDVLFMSRIID